MTSVRLSDFVKVNDVRGLVPEQLTERVASAFGAAFAQVVAIPDDKSSIVVGHDMRPSSPSLSRAFAEGAAARGVDVTMMGLASTDGLYYASGALDVPGAMFTASHNPAQYNGIKLCRSGARPVGQDSGLPQVRDLAQEMLDRDAGGSGDSDQIDAAKGQSAPEVGKITDRDLLGDYARYLRDRVDLAGIRPLTVVVDAGNGMAGHTVPAVLGQGAGLSALPVRVIPLFFELDGTFPNHPANPLVPENLLDLERAVVQHGADLGLAFDGDADRCFVVDERGAPVSPSAITGLVATREIAKERAAGRDPVIVYNAITSTSVPEVIAEQGARGVRTRVGHAYIKAVMAENDAIFGGEHSAHYYFRDFWFADTGMLAALHVLAALGQQAGPLSALVASYTRYADSGEINSTVSDPPATIAAVRAWAQDRDVAFDELDGLTGTHREAPFWWFNLRPSNTEPLLRLNVEAVDAATMEQVRDDVLAVVRSQRPATTGER